MMSETSSETTFDSEDDQLQALFDLYKNEANQDVNDLELAAEIVTKEQLQLEQSARALLEDAQKATDASMVPVLEEQARGIRDSCIHIHDFASRFYQKNQLPWTYVAGGTRIVALLSDIHEAIRALASGRGTGMEKWVATSSFERFTKKYLINEGHLAHVLLYCASEVPILVYGKTGTILTNKNDTTMKDIWQTHLATPLSSVYFDSPDMNLYAGRVAREEGARLLRVRWYGNKRPEGDEVLFLELKTHHESWVMDKSIKQRLSLRERDMTALLARDGSKWKRAFMEQLLRLATPSLKGKKLDDAVALLHEIRTLIVEKDLRPLVRTRYLRMAFQSNDTNARRLTIDRDITVTDESSASLGRWCVDTIDAKTAVKVPNAVLEVKLKENDDPAFVHELLHMNAIQDGLKFSKYMTGAITLHSEKVKTTPYWTTLPVFDGLFDSKEGPAKRDKPSRSNESRKTSRFSSMFLLSSLKRRSSESILPSTTQDLPKTTKVKKVRIEPKTYFANERTFIQWISVALLLVTIATLLIGIAADEGINAPRVMSMVLVFAGLFITVYAFATYFRRLYLLKNGKSYGYVDHTGPVILTAAVLMGVIGLVYYTFNFGADTSSTSSNAYQVVTEDPRGRCQVHNFTGISLLEYQPSDIVLNETSNTLIIPSQSQVTSLPSNSEEVPSISVLADVPDTDIEAVAYTEGTLYAVSESKGSSLLLAFESLSGGTETTLELIGQWKLEGRSSTEGMTYANDGKLYISEGADIITGESSVYVYDIPTIEPTNGTIIPSIFPLYQLNGKVLTTGISPSKSKMGSMTFFEDVLYILHDNARVIRGWNLESGAMVSEWILPRVGDEFDQQWEGMALSRVGATDENTNSLRGSTGSTVVLYLAFDSPPQIWSFQMKEEPDGLATSKSYAFPECAAAF